MSIDIAVTSHPVVVVDLNTYNKLSVNPDGSISERLLDSSGTSITVGQKAMIASVPVVIASDQVSAIPQVEYISRFTKNNQVYGFSSTIAAAVAGVDNPICFIRNPSGSGKVLYLYLVHAGTLIANVGFSFHITANPTATANGTIQTPTSLNIGGGAGASSMLVTTLPTITAVGSILATIDVGQNSSAIKFGDGFSIAINPNNSLLFTANPSSNNRNVDFTIQWAEL